MNSNVSYLPIGILGAAITLSAYSQTFISLTQCVTVGLLVLISGLLANEGQFEESTTNQPSVIIPFGFWCPSSGDILVSKPFGRATRDFLSILWEVTF